MSGRRGQRLSADDDRRPSAVPPRIWFQLAFLVIILVLLLVYMTRIGERSAGCFVQLTAPPDAVAPAAAPPAPAP